MKNIKLKETLIIFLKGLCMGIADIIPGISGGTIALITGIYERLVHSISKIGFKKEKIRNIDFNLFIPLLLGIGLAFLLMSNVVWFFLQNLTALTYAFLSGLILASAIFLYKKVASLSIKNVLVLIVGFLFAFLFTGSTTLKIGHSLPIIFLSGIIAICAMILPGISGAFILLFLNQYEYMLSVLKNLQFLEIFIFCLGALLGILSFSRFLDYILNKYKSFTMYFLIGVMVGALRGPCTNILSISTVNLILPILISAILGFFIIFILESKLRKLAKTSQNVK